MVRTNLAVYHYESRDTSCQRKLSHLTTFGNFFRDHREGPMIDNGAPNIVSYDYKRWDSDLQLNASLALSVMID